MFQVLPAGRDLQAEEKTCWFCWKGGSMALQRALGRSRSSDSEKAFMRAGCRCSTEVLSQGEASLVDFAHCLSPAAGGCKTWSTHSCRLAIAFHFWYLNCMCLTKSAIWTHAMVNRGRGLSRRLFHPILNHWMICSLPLFLLVLVGWNLLSLLRVVFGCQVVWRHIWSDAAAPSEVSPQGESNSAV